MEYTDLLSENEINNKVYMYIEPLSYHIKLKSHMDCLVNT